LKSSLLLRLEKKGGFVHSPVPKIKEIFFRRLYPDFDINVKNLIRLAIVALIQADCLE